MGRATVLTVDDDPDIDDHCQSYMASFDGMRGPDHVLAKPVDRDALLEKLETFAARSTGAGL